MQIYKEAIMARGKEKGEVFVVMLAFMLASGLVLWLATGRFHMMPVHGKKGMYMEDSSPATDGPRRDVSAPPSRCEGERSGTWRGAGVEVG